VTDGIELEAPKTRLLVNQLKQWGLGQGPHIVEAQDEKLFLAARNLPYVEVIEAAGFEPGGPWLLTTRCWSPAARKDARGALAMETASS